MPERNQKITRQRLIRRIAFLFAAVLAFAAAWALLEAASGPSARAYYMRARHGRFFSCEAPLPPLLAEPLGSMSRIPAAGEPPESFLPDEDEDALDRLPLGRDPALVVTGQADSKDSEDVDQ